jgi:hypothetical protein
MSNTLCTYNGLINFKAYQIHVLTLSDVGRLSIFDSPDCILALKQVIFLCIMMILGMYLNKVIDLEPVDGLCTHLELVNEYSALLIIVSALNLTINVSPFLF